MLVNKAYKFRMYPNDEQRQLIDSFIGTARFIYNHYLYENKNNKYFNYFNVAKDVKNLKEEYSWLKEVDGCLIQNALKDLDKAYMNYNKKQGGYPKYKKKSINGSYKTTAIRSIYNGKEYCNIELDLKNKIIKLPKLKEVQIRGYRNLKELNCKILNATIKRETDRYYVSVSVTEDVEVKENTTLNAVGLDLGVKTLVTTSDGKKYDKINITKEEKRIEKLNRKLARSKKGSNNFNKTIIKLERVYQKIRNKRKYTTHEITTKIVKENKIIVTETLKTKEMIEKGKLSKLIINSVFAEVIRQLKYKAAWYKKKLIQVNEYYASSQLCNQCGYKNTSLKDLNIRKYNCPNCESILDRDINASINIEYEGVLIYYKELLNA